MTLKECIRGKATLETTFEGEIWNSLSESSSKNIPLPSGGCSSACIFVYHTEQTYLIFQWILISLKCLKIIYTISDWSTQFTLRRKMKKWNFQNLFSSLQCSRLMSKEWNFCIENISNIMARFFMNYSAVDMEEFLFDKNHGMDLNHLEFSDFFFADV